MQWLLAPMLMGVVQGRFFGMVMGVGAESESRIAMMSRFLVIASGQVFGCCAMIISGLLKILGCLFMVFGGFLVLLRMVSCHKNWGFEVHSQK